MTQDCTPDSPPETVDRPSPIVPKNPIATLIERANLDSEHMRKSLAFTAAEWKEVLSTGGPLGSFLTLCAGMSMRHRMVVTPAEFHAIIPWPAMDLAVSNPLLRRYCQLDRPYRTNGELWDAVYEKRHLPVAQVKAWLEHNWYPSPHRDAIWNEYEVLGWMKRKRTHPASTSQEQLFRKPQGKFEWRQYVKHKLSLAMFPGVPLGMVTYTMRMIENDRDVEFAASNIPTYLITLNLLVIQRLIDPGFEWCWLNYPMKEE